MLQDVIGDLDVILIMSVNPGFSGQSFIPNALKKVREARSLIDRFNPACALEIDGGVGRDNIADVVAAGVDTIVMGSSIFGAKDPGAELRALRALAQSVAAAAAS
jgi:ribulose-phosphate 3-epimerase